MHYYKRNLGDYAKKAGRLSMLQHGAYTLLLDACYDREQFPTREQAIEWAWASSQDEIDAVDFVLSRFFQCQDDGTYIQQRVAEELYEYACFCESQKAKGKKGGRPKKPNGLLKKPGGLNNKPIGNPSVTQPKPKETLTTNHKPLTTNQLQSKAMSGKPDDARLILDYLNEKTGKAFRPVPSNITLINARLKERYSVDEIKAVIDRKVLQWPEGDKMHEYLRPATLFGATNFNQYVGEIGKPLPNGGSNGSHQQARKLSVGERATEHRKRAERIWAEQENAGRAVGADDAHLRPPLDGEFRRDGD